MACKAISCTNPEDFPDISGELAEVFLNAAVSQAVACDAGKSLVFTGSLPLNITVDSVNNTLTIAGGIFSGATQESANEAAATYLSGFIEDNSGSIECIGCEITTASVSTPTVGEAYSDTIAQSGFSSPFWSISSGSLPSGLSINSGTGEISGEPTYADDYTFTVRAAFEEGSTVYCEQEFTVTVDPSPDCSSAPAVQDAVWIEPTGGGNNVLPIDAAGGLATFSFLLDSDTDLIWMFQLCNPITSDYTLTFQLDYSGEITNGGTVDSLVRYGDVGPPGLIPTEGTVIGVQNHTGPGIISRSTGNTFNMVSKDAEWFCLQIAIGGGATGNISGTLTITPNVPTP